MSIIKEAWAQRLEDPREQAKREEGESERVDRRPTTGTSIHPGWATRVEANQYWIHLTLYQPINERWVEETRRPRRTTGRAASSSMTDS